jgi:hypothetical protein
MLDRLAILPDGERQAAEEAARGKPLDKAAYRCECLNRERDGGSPDDEPGCPKRLPEALANAPEGKGTTGILDRAAKIVESLTRGTPKGGTRVARRHRRDEVPDGDAQSKGRVCLSQRTKKIRDQCQQCAHREEDSERNETLLRRPELAEFADGVPDLAITRTASPNHDQDDEEVGSCKNSESYRWHSEDGRSNLPLGGAGRTRRGNTPGTRQRAGPQPRLVRWPGNLKRGSHSTHDILAFRPGPAHELGKQTTLARHD